MDSLRMVLSVCMLCVCLLSQSVPSANAIDIPQHLKASAKKLHGHCQKLTGVPEEVIRQGHDGNFPDDPLLKCYIHCLFDTLALIDKNNIVHLENLMEILPPETHEIFNNLIQKCGTKAGADGCETAFNTLKCYFDADQTSLMKAFNFLFD